MLFVPFDEVPEGWRKTSLVWIACLIGWHFGQVAVSKPWMNPVWMKCSKCHAVYEKKVVCEIRNDS